VCVGMRWEGEGEGVWAVGGEGVGGEGRGAPGGGPRHQIPKKIEVGRPSKKQLPIASYSFGVTT
jgi:hypothetical protein